MLFMKIDRVIISLTRTVVVINRTKIANYANFALVIMFLYSITL